LEAAHLKENSRKKIIDLILEKYLINNSHLIKIDLQKGENEIIEAHKPIEKYFLFLCSKCHINYDSK
jgi:hypothetical protein